MNSQNLPLLKANKLRSLSKFHLSPYLNQLSITLFSGDMLPVQALLQAV